jgi:hypothetical protein
MKSMLQPETREEVRRRLASVPADRAPLWGDMTAPRMVAHLADAMRMALGDLHVPQKRMPLRYPPLKQLVLYVVPFPRGAPTARELIDRAPGDIDAERRAIDGLLERLGARTRDAPAPAHPIFGPLTVRQWGVLGYKHTDHHLRQFGA